MKNTAENVPVTPEAGKLYRVFTLKPWRDTFTLWSEKRVRDTSKSGTLTRIRLASIKLHEIVLYIGEYKVDGVVYDKVGYKDLFGFVRNDSILFCEAVEE